MTGHPIDLGPRLVSTTLLETYTVVKIIGAGPIGAALEVEENNTKKRFAAKLIHPRFTRDAPEAAAALVADLKTASAIDSPHVARIYKVGKDTGAAIVSIRELMTGECLASRLDQVGQFSLTAAIKIIREVLLALESIHAKNILNLDLSPADVFLSSTEDGMVVKLVDIGERHIKHLYPDGISKLESAKYYAPEQYDRTRQLNHRTDIFAAGAIFYQMLTGVAPEGEPAPIESSRRDIPPALSQIVTKALSTKPSARFQSAREFINSLDSVDLTDAPIRRTSGPPVSPATEDDTPASVIVEMPEIQKRGPKIAILVAAVVLSVAVGVVLWQALRGSGGEGLAEPEEQVTIRINVVPSSATIKIDGKRIESNPAIITVPADKVRLHTISAKADGFEPMERDIRFDISRDVALELMEIIQPDGEDEPDIIAEPLPMEAAATDNTAAGAAASAVTPRRPKPAAKRSVPQAHERTERQKKRRASSNSPEKKRTKSAGDKTAQTPGTAKKERRIKGFRTDNPFD